MAPLVTVLIPTHNRPDTLKLAIESALAQTLADFELLVVGDGCTDHTGELVRGFGDPRVVWLDLPKAPGFGYANRNRALRDARGTFVAYLAHDDLWLPDHLERLTACLVQADADWAYSRPLDVSMDGHIRPQVFNLHDPIAQRMWRERHQGYLSITNVMHLRSCFSRDGFWHEGVKRSGDWELWMRILDGGHWRRLAFDPIPTSFHFLAKWRQTTVSRRHRWLRRLWSWEGSLLPDLRVPVPEAMLEQDAVWRACQQAPVEFMRSLRRAVQVDLDRRSRLAFPLSSLLEAGAAFRHRVMARPRPWPAYTR